MNSSAPIKVLLVEDNPDYAKVLRKRLSKASNARFQVEYSEKLKFALEVLAKGMPDAVLLDLSLPDSDGLETFRRVRAQAPEVPVVVLTGLDDEKIALESVRQGAQDYILKGQPNEKTISQALQYAIERNRSQMKLRRQALTDELTGLYNRRAFSLLCHQQLKLASRAKKAAILFFFDVDDFKQINDQYGHPRGDQALIRIAEALRSTFRKSDVLARMGGDEFAVLANDVESEDSTKIILTRLDENLKEAPRQRRNRLHLSLSSGTAFFDPQRPCSTEALINIADRAMYRWKRNKQAASGRLQKKILIVEDDPGLQKILGLRLKKSGYEAVAVSDGPEGLKEARRAAPDLIILDLILPGLSGEEVCKAIREDEDEKFSRIPIIMLTAKSSDVDRIIGKMIGANDYVAKPFDPDSLLEKIRKALVPSEK